MMTFEGSQCRGVADIAKKLMVSKMKRPSNTVDGCYISFCLPRGLQPIDSLKVALLVIYMYEETVSIFNGFRLMHHNDAYTGYLQHDAVKRFSYLNLDES